MPRSQAENENQLLQDMAEKAKAELNSKANVRTRMSSKPVQTLADYISIKICQKPEYLAPVKKKLR